MVRGDGDNMSETSKLVVRNGADEGAVTVIEEIIIPGGWSSQWSEDSKPQMKFTKPSHKTRHSVGQVKRAGGRVFRKKVT